MSLGFEISDWVAADGLMSLNKGGRRPSYLPANDKNRLNTCDNDNGIHYLTLFIFLCMANDLEIISLGSYLESIHLIRHKTIAGLYHRSAGRINYINSHDNLISMSCGCILVNNTEIFDAIVKYGKKHWYILNDENPGLHLKLRRDHPSGLHQPHAWFMYLLAAGDAIRPSFFTTLWNVGNLMHTAYFTPHYSHHDSHYLAWLRVEAILLVLARPNQKKLMGWKKKITVMAISVFRTQMQRKSRGLKVYFNNFIDGHPIRILASKLNF